MSVARLQPASRYQACPEWIADVSAINSHPSPPPPCDVQKRSIETCSSTPNFHPMFYRHPPPHPKLRRYFRSSSGFPIRPSTPFPPIIISLHLLSLTVCPPSTALIQNIVPVELTASKTSISALSVFPLYVSCSSPSRLFTHFFVSVFLA